MAKTPIEFFINRLQEINETDYGDFMRKANFYLIELDDDIYQSSSKETQKMLDVMKNEIQFHPNWKIEPTRVEILEMAKLLQRKLLTTKELR